MDPEIVKLRQVHVEAIVIQFEAAPPSYSQYFTPFPITRDVLRQKLDSARLDRYYVILAEHCPAGFYMLRGLDEGYASPMYGVWISPSYSGRGFALATLEHAVGVCRELGACELLLKVHPCNLKAVRLYRRFGFEMADPDPATGSVLARFGVRAD